MEVVRAVMEHALVGQRGAFLDGLIIGSYYHLFHNILAGNPGTTHTITCSWFASTVPPISSTNATLGSTCGSLYAPPRLRQEKMSFLYVSYRQYQSLRHIYRHRASYILEETWHVIDSRVALLRYPKCNKIFARALGQNIKALLNGDRRL